MLQVTPVGVSSWQHVLPERQVEVVEDVGLGLQHINGMANEVHNTCL